MGASAASRTLRTPGGARARLLVAPDEAAWEAAGVDALRAALGAAPEPSVCFATGETPKPLYAALLGERAAGRLDLAGLRAFQLDEFLGLGPRDPLSFRAFLEERLYGPAGLAADRIDSPRGDAPDPEAECARYESAIAGAGGFDLAILGVGRNGHIAFNEPGAAADSRTRVIRFTPETRAQHEAAFAAAGRATPERALTVGVGTLLGRSRAILLLARGASKAEALRRAFAEPPSADCPASFLQGFKGALTVLADEAAASGL